MKYRICENRNGKYKVQYKRRWTLCWFNLKKSYGRSYIIKIFDTIEHAEKGVVREKKRVALKRKKYENKTRSNTWSCMGEY